MIAENALFTAEVPESGVIDGHVRFRLAKTDPESVAVAGLCANLVSGLLFERLKVQGTNLIINLSDGEGRIDVVARNQDDGLGLTWNPGQPLPEKLDEAQARISERLIPAAPKVEKRAERAAAVEVEEDEEQLVKQLRRIP